MVDEDFRVKSPDAGRMGKAAEHLVAASCILVTRGQLNVSTSLVDDEGVDLVFHRRDSSATLAVQVKSRMSDAKSIGRNRFRAQVRSQTFRPRTDLDMLFVAIDVKEGRYTVAYLVPSPDFSRMAPVNSQDRLVFSASLKLDSADQWSPYRLTPDRLPAKIMDRLAELERSGL
jgi:hypothetical protein